MIHIPAAIYIAAAPAPPTQGRSASNVIDLHGAWTGFWSAITTSWSGITTAMTFIGIILVVFALVKWAWDRRRGGGMQGSAPLMGALIPGALLLAPGTIIPLLLWIIDVIANIVLTIVQKATGN